ncbi:hypothetical protein DFP72DRAFT_1074462 [Ephemerocybe angulata]|uniref:Uncharacterized protein n=1 Tax=Ephemerocybe angulata TaxID=980116 RepID=A0A8H6HJH8_9AGAR|nr:hypothetical protein DFP72DRAFT_1074462 [Tulosesus angulatus]
MSVPVTSATVTGTPGPANHEFLGVEDWVAIPDNAGSATSTAATVVAAQAGDLWTMDINKNAEGWLALW